MTTHLQARTTSCSISTLRRCFAFSRTDSRVRTRKPASAHILTSTSIGNRNLGTSYLFGSDVGVGYRFDRKGFEIGYRFQHISNAGIKEPNDGINFHQLRLQYHY